MHEKLHALIVQLHLLDDHQLDLLAERYTLDAEIFTTVQCIDQLMAELHQIAPEISRELAALLTSIHTTRTELLTRLTDSRVESRLQPAPARYGEEADNTAAVLPLCDRAFLASMEDRLTAPRD